MEIAVIDLDGVIFESPVRETVSDHGFWFNYWHRPQDHVPNKEILSLMRALAQAGIHVFILTARPTTVLDPTLKALLHHCMISPQICADVLEHEFEYGKQYHLMMCDVDLYEDGWQGAGSWKLDVIENLKIGYEVLFCVEDYKPNAEEIRKAIPVLLYERRRRGD